MARPSAVDRIARILAIVPWIAGRDGPTIAEVCERFAIDEAALLADLDLVFLCGLYPYTPENLVEVLVDEGRVWIEYTNFFERPLRLTPPEALAILTAGKAAAGHPGAEAGGPLARGLAKVAAVLGVDLDDDLEVVVSAEEAELLAALDRGIEDRQVLRARYFSHARNVDTEREIEPLARFVDDGAWYLDAHCRTADAVRVFRVDRFSELVPTGERFERTPGRRTDAAFAEGDLPRVTLRLPASAAWVAQQYPVDEVDVEADGRVRVRLAVSAGPWLERLLLRIGPDAELVDAPTAFASTGADAARRLLTRYEDAPAAAGEPDHVR